MSDDARFPIGGGFLWEPTGSRQIMAPERFTDEQHEMARAGRQFSDKEIIPRLKEIESKKVGLIPELLRKAGELGGTAQAGDAETIGNIVDDFAVYMRAKAAADEIVARDPDLSAPEHRPLLALLNESASARAMLVTA